MAPLSVPLSPEAAAAAESARRRELLWLALRLSIPVVGVAFLGWPQLTAALFYIFEAWLFVVVRITTEQVLHPKVRQAGVLVWVGNILRSMLGIGFVVAMFGGLSIVALSQLFYEQEWQDFAGGGWKNGSFLVSVAALLALQTADVHLFVKAWRAGRTEAQKRIHEIEKVSRILALIACNFVVALGQGIGLAGFVQVLAMSIVMFLIESNQSWRKGSNRLSRKERRRRLEYERQLEGEKAG